MQSCYCNPVPAIKTIKNRGSYAPLQKFWLRSWLGAFHNHDNELYKRIWFLFLGHSMSGDLAKWGFFIWSSPKFYKGKDLRPLSSTKLEFLKSDLCFRKYEHLKFWCFSWGLDQKILGVLLLELQLGRLHAEQNNTARFLLVTFEPWLITVIRQHVFHVHSSMTIF